MVDDSKKTLKDRGTIILCGDVNKENIKTTAIELLEVDNKPDADYDHINLILNSPGGSCRDGFMLIDIIGLCRRPIHITGLGICASMGFIILCSGTKGFRKITNNTTLMSHQFSWEISGKRHELVSARKQEEILHERLVLHLVQHSNLDKEEVEKKLMPETDVWLTPQQALEYGIVDEILK